MKALIVGLGSIAEKHIKSLKKINSKIELFAFRSGFSQNLNANVVDVHDKNQIPSDLDFVLICNPTYRHRETIQEFLYLGKPFFIEKPSFMSVNEGKEIMDLVKINGIRTYVGFNFRFHPVINWLKDNLSKFNLFEVNIYCGSYLPDWRPGKDYSLIYSSSREMGGGVNLDLIHEMDYTLWLFGKPRKSTSFSAKVSTLNINSNDFAHYLLEYPNMNVSITLNYYRKDPKRYIEVVTDRTTIYADLISGIIINSDNEVIFSYSNPIQETYYMQMRYFLNTLEKSSSFMNDIEESLVTLDYALNKQISNGK